jgi:outer membrane immunogenic protein
MKRFGLAAFAVAFGSSAALAADMPLKAPPPIVVYNWTGCYLGLSAGENYGRTGGFVNTPASTLGGNPALPLPPGFNETGPFKLSGFIGGAFAGCNYQFAGGWVIGAEVDWSVTNKEGQSFPVANQIVNNNFIGNPNDQWWLQERWLGTARLRLGYAVTDKWLWYVTGGGAWAKVDASETIIGVQNRPQEGAFQGAWRGGWTVGLGTEYMVGYGWTIRSEFLYVDLGSWTTFTNIPNGIQGIDTFTNLRGNLRDYIFRFGMSYKFGWTPAVVANY